MPLAARHLYADGLSAPSMLFWRYAIAILALGTAATLARAQAVAGLAARRVAHRAARRDFRRRPDAVLLGKHQDARDQHRGTALLHLSGRDAGDRPAGRSSRGCGRWRCSCIAAILCGAALITGPGLHGGALDPRGLAWAVPAPLLYAVYLAINTRLLRRHPALIGATGLYLGMAVTFGLISALARPRHPD